MSQKLSGIFAATAAFALGFSASIMAADPSWSSGRNSSNQLTVNAGPLGTIAFSSEVKGAAPRETECTGNVPCDRVAYDFTRDGYEGRPMGSCLVRGQCSFEDKDLAHPVWKDGRYRHVLIKNWNIKNAFKTSGSPHVDVTQILDSPGWGGWFVMQDSTLENSDDGIVQWQFGYGSGTYPDYGGRSAAEVGGVLIQNVNLNQSEAFNADCRARERNGGFSDGCHTGNFLGTAYPTVLWAVNYNTGNWKVTLQQTWEKVIVVGKNPNFDFRTGDYGFSVRKTCSAPSPCLASGRIFGPYPSIEAAIADGHAEPPFARLSCSGWADPRNCSGAAIKAPLPPELQSIQ
jgi:hypothetical protein